MTSQLKIFSDTEIFKRKDQECIEGFDIHSYDLYLIAFSGGKDSVALFFFVLEANIPKHKIILCHHLVDGLVPLEQVEKT